MYVYKITNQINNKVYIGITNNYKKRWSNECCNSKDPKRQQVITRAIEKYGKDNFHFEILYSHLTIEEACEKEKELIQFYGSLTPEGYNVDPGGEYHPHGHPMYGSKNGNSKLSDEQAQYIKDHRNLPMYVLYEEFNDILSWEAFKKCYQHITYTNIPITVEEYPYNLQYSAQFHQNGLEYDEVVDIRQRYANGEHWEKVYEDYKRIYTNKLSFWRAYTGLSYKLVMPEVFTEENKKLHSSKGKGSKNVKAKLTEEDVRNIRKKHKEGYSNSEIYKLYPNLTPTSLRDVINYKTWKHILEN